MALQSTTALATITLQSASSSVTFSGIPSTYRDLVLVVNAEVTGNGNFTLKLNNDSGNSSSVQMYGDGSSAVSFTETNPVWALWISGQQHLGIFQIMDYSATDKHKTTLGRVNRSNGIALAGASRWASNTAVSSLVVTLSANSFSIGSTFSLYGRIA
jgi:hypothetical protein